jgi:hypothetical protein
MTTSHEMTVLKCSGKDCQAYITVNEPTTSSTTYTCKDHTHQAKKPDVHFQNFQFDEDLDRSSKPEGTGHVHHQASSKRTRVRMLDGTVRHPDGSFE